MLMKKTVAIAVLGCALLASQAFAYETGEYSKEALRRVLTEMGIEPPHTTSEEREKHQDEN